MSDPVPLLLSTHDIKGGAARAAYRVHRGLLDEGIDSKMRVQHKRTSDPTVEGPETVVGSRINEFRYYINHSPLVPNYLLGNPPQRKFTPGGILSHNDKFGSRHNIVHLNWISGFLTPRDISSIETPIVWTLHDMWPLTGGCHYSNSCKKYSGDNGCRSCPVFEDKNRRDIAKKEFEKKRKMFSQFSGTLVAPSKWMRDRAKDSALFKSIDVKVIPNGLRVDKYRPINQLSARNRLGLPTDEKLILFGALNPMSDRRKGFPELLDALNYLSNTVSSEEIGVAAFGSDKLENDFALPEVFESYPLGFLPDSRLPVAYSAADVTMIPSLVESFGQTAAESLSCGTPVVAFDTSGLKDIITHKETGYLANPYSSDSLANGVRWVLKDNDRVERLSENARNEAISRFGIKTVTQQYLELYQSII